MNTAAYLCQLLKQYDVDCVFGIPGVHTLELYRSLPEANIEHVTPRHEQGAGFMADGYARVTGKPGVCFIISGPGMTNILTAMGQAWSESVPMLVISTVNSHGRMGSGEGWLHELPDQQKLVSGVCEFSHTIHSPIELESVIARAFAVFDSGRPRPVHIEIPINILASPSPQRKPKILRLARPMGNNAALNQAAEMLNESKAPIILAGGGATYSSAELQILAEKIDAPVIMTVNARGVLASDHLLAVPASASLQQTRALIEESDVVLALGTELGPTDYDFNEDGKFEISGKLIRVDIDAQQLMRTRVPEVGIIGDVSASVEAMIQLVNPSHKSRNGAQRASNCIEQLTQSQSPRDKKYLQFLSIANEHLDQPIIVGDSTQIIYTTNSFYGSNKANHYFNSAMGFGTLGYALPAAIGAAIGSPTETVLAISGDGGLQFCLAELATAYDSGASLVLVIHENGGYHEIKKFMIDSGIQPVGVDLSVPDVSTLAIACGWSSHRVESFAQLPSIFQDCRTNSTPTLILMSDQCFD